MEIPVLSRAGFVSKDTRAQSGQSTAGDSSESVSTFSGREGRTGKRGKRARSWREKDMVNQSNAQPNNLLNNRFLYYRSVPDERAIRDTFGDAGGDASASPRW